MRQASSTYHFARARRIRDTVDDILNARSNEQATSKPPAYLRGRLRDRLVYPNIRVETGNNSRLTVAVVVNSCMFDLKTELARLLSEF